MSETGTGWVKLHRKLLDSKYGSNASFLGLWAYILLKANHKDGYDRDGNLIKAGSFRTGRLMLSRETGIKPTTLERMLSALVDAKQIGQQKTNKYRIISVTNWHSYQAGGHQMDIKRTTDGHQTDTNKNDKNKKNDNNNADEKNFQISVKKILELLGSGCLKISDAEEHGFTLTESEKDFISSNGGLRSLNGFSEYQLKNLLFEEISKLKRPNEKR